MKITVSHIPPDGHHVHFTEKPDHFPVLADMIARKEIAFSGPVTGEIRVQVMSEDLVEIRGRIGTTLALTCGRCLEPFEQPIAQTFELNFVNTGEKGDETNGEGGEREILDRDISTEYFSGDVIELSDILQEQIVMNLPARPLCNEVCKGLCPSCGVNLNQSSCTCKPVTGHPAFTVLKGLKT